MIRIAICCLGLILLQPAAAAASSIYAASPFFVLEPTSTSTFQSPGIIPTKPGANAFVLSPNGKTLYFEENGEIVSIDIATNKTVHTYQTQYPITLPFVILPDESQIYVSTCALDIINQCYAGYVEVFDVASQRELAAVSMDQDQVYRLVAAPNGVTVYALHTYNEPDCCHTRPREGSQRGERGGSAVVPSNSVTGIDVASLSIGASFVPPLYLIPQSIAVAAGSTIGYVLGFDEYDDSWLYSVDLTQMVTTGSLMPTQYYAGVGMVMSGNGTTLGVQIDGQLYFFDAATGLLIESEPTSGGLWSLSPDGKTGYVVVGSGVMGDAVSSLQTLEVQTGAVQTVITGRDIRGILPAPSGKEIYLIAESGVQAFKEGAPMASKLFDVGNPTAWLAVSPDGSTLYSAGQNGVWAISTATGAVTSKLLGGLQISAIALSPDGQTLYALDADTFSFIIVNTSTGTVVNTIAVPFCSAGVYLSGSIAINRVGTLAFTTVNPCGAVAVINLMTQTMAGQIPHSSGSALAVSPATGYIWSSAGSSVQAYDLTTHKVVGSVPIQASSVAFSPDGSVAYVAGYMNANGVAVVNASSFAVTSFIPGGEGSGGQSIAVTADGKWIYVGGGDVINAQSLQVAGLFVAGPPVLAH